MQRDQQPMTTMEMSQSVDHSITFWEETNSLEISSGEKGQNITRISRKLAEQREILSSNKIKVFSMIKTIEPLIATLHLSSGLESFKAKEITYIYFIAEGIIGIQVNLGTIRGSIELVIGAFQVEESSTLEYVEADAQFQFVTQVKGGSSADPPPLMEVGKDLAVGDGVSGIRAVAVKDQTEGAGLVKACRHIDALRQVETPLLLTQLAVGHGEVPGITGIEHIVIPQLTHQAIGSFSGNGIVFREYAFDGGAVVAKPAIGPTSELEGLKLGKGEVGRIVGLRPDPVPEQSRLQAELCFCNLYA